MTPPLPAAELDRLSELLKKATPGPWACAEYQRGVEIATVCHVGDFVVGQPTPGYPGGNYRDTDWGSVEDDAKFIVALHNAAPSLLASARREARLEALLRENQHWMPKKAYDDIAHELREQRHD